MKRKEKGCDFKAPLEIVTYWKGSLALTIPQSGDYSKQAAHLVFPSLDRTSSRFARSSKQPPLTHGHLLPPSRTANSGLIKQRSCSCQGCVRTPTQPSLASITTFNPLHEDNTHNARAASSAILPDPIGTSQISMDAGESNLEQDQCISVVAGPCWTASRIWFGLT